MGLPDPLGTWRPSPKDSPELKQKMDEIIDYCNRLRGYFNDGSYYGTGIKLGNCGATSATDIGADRVNAIKVICPIATSISTISVQLGSVNSSNYKLGIYTDSSGAPDVLLGETSAVAVGASDDYFQITGTFSTAVTLTANTYYWLAFISDTNNQSYYTIGVTQNGKYKDGGTYAAGLPDPFGSPTGNQVSWTIWGA